MKKLIIISILVAMVVGCASGYKHHKTALPDPKSYNAHFGDMDGDGDELVSWDEFRTFFEHAEPNVFKAVDSNRDGRIDHDEWHAYKEAHGLKHLE